MTDAEQIIADALGATVRSIKHPRHVYLVEQPRSAGLGMLYLTAKSKPARSRWIWARQLWEQYELLPVKASSKAKLIKRGK